MEEKRRSLDRDVGRMEGKIDQLLNMAHMSLEKDKEQDALIHKIEMKVHGFSAIGVAVLATLQGLPIIREWINSVKT